MCWGFARMDLNVNFVCERQWQKLSPGCSSLGHPRMQKMSYLHHIAAPSFLNTWQHAQVPLDGFIVVILN